MTLAVLTGARDTLLVLADVKDERVRQEMIGAHKRLQGIDWRSCADPEMAGGDATRFLVLGEEVGEVANAVLEAGYAGSAKCSQGCEQGAAGTHWHPARSDEHLREELVQVAAVAVAWIEAIDARAGR